MSSLVFITFLWCENDKLLKLLLKRNPGHFTNGRFWHISTALSVMLIIQTPVPHHCKGVTIIRFITVHLLCQRGRGKEHSSPCPLPP